MTVVVLDQITKVMVLDRFEPELQSALDARDLAELKARGAGLEDSGRIAEVVPIGTRE